MKHEEADMAILPEANKSYIIAQKNKGRKKASKTDTTKKFLSLSLNDTKSH